MVAVLIRNPSVDQDVDGPAKPDGTRYRFEMIYQQGRSRAYADTATELVGVFIAGYEEMSEEDRLRARVEYTTGLLAPVQATVLQGFDGSELTEAERAVLFQPRHAPVVVEEWSAQVPLVLLDVHYAPYSDIPAPVSALEDVYDPSNIYWLRAADEFDFLTALHRIGIISLGESNDFVV